MLATILVADDGDLVGGIPQERLRGFGIAPPRAVSLDLAVKYAHVVNGVILQVRFWRLLSCSVWGQRDWQDWLDVATAAWHSGRTLFAWPND
jgi:hypothetical protein